MDLCEWKKSIERRGILVFRMKTAESKMYERAAIAIRNLRKKRGWSQLQLAAEAELSSATIGRAESLNCNRRPKPGSYLQIAEVLQVPLETLFAEPSDAEIKGGIAEPHYDVRGSEMSPILTLRKITDDGNWYGYEIIEILAFNYDGQGTALVRQDGEVSSYGCVDLELIIHGDPGEGTRWYEPIGPMATEPQTKSDTPESSERGRSKVSAT